MFSIANLICSSLLLFVLNLQKVCRCFSICLHGSAILSVHPRPSLLSESPLPPISMVDLGNVSNLADSPATSQGEQHHSETCGEAKSGLCSTPNGATGSRQAKSRKFSDAAKVSTASATPSLVDSGSPASGDDLCNNARHRVSACDSYLVSISNDAIPTLLASGSVQEHGSAISSLSPSCVIYSVEMLASSHHCPATAGCGACSGVYPSPPTTVRTTSTPSSQASARKCSQERGNPLPVSDAFGENEESLTQCTAVTEIIDNTRQYLVSSWKHAAALRAERNANELLASAASADWEAAQPHKTKGKQHRKAKKRRTAARIACDSPRALQSGVKAATATSSGKNDGQQIIGSAASDQDASDENASQREQRQPNEPITTSNACSPDQEGESPSSDDLSNCSDGSTKVLAPDEAIGVEGDDNFSRACRPSSSFAGPESGGDASCRQENISADVPASEGMPRVGCAMAAAIRCDLSGVADGNRLKKEEKSSETKPREGRQLSVTATALDGEHSTDDDNDNKSLGNDSGDSCLGSSRSSSYSANLDTEHLVCASLASRTMHGAQSTDPLQSIAASLTSAAPVEDLYASEEKRLLPTGLNGNHSGDVVGCSKCPIRPADCVVQTSDCHTSKSHSAATLLTSTAAGSSAHSSTGEAACHPIHTTVQSSCSYSSRRCLMRECVSCDVKLPATLELPAGPPSNPAANVGSSSSPIPASTVAEHDDEGPWITVRRSHCPPSGARQSWTATSKGSPSGRRQRHVPKFLRENIQNPFPNSIADFNKRSVALTSSGTKSSLHVMPPVHIHGKQNNFTGNGGARNSSACSVSVPLSEVVPQLRREAISSTSCSTPVQALMCVSTSSAAPSKARNGLAQTTWSQASPPCPSASDISSASSGLDQRAWPQLSYVPQTSSCGTATPKPVSSISRIADTSPKSDMPGILPKPPAQSNMAPFPTDIGKNGQPSQGIQRTASAQSTASRDSVAAISIPPPITVISGAGDENVGSHSTGSKRHRRKAARHAKFPTDNTATHYCTMRYPPPFARLRTAVTSYASNHCSHTMAGRINRPMPTSFAAQPLTASAMTSPRLPAPTSSVATSVGLGGIHCPCCGSPVMPSSAPVMPVNSPIHNPPAEHHRANPPTVHDLMNAKGSRHPPSGVTGECQDAFHNANLYLNHQPTTSGLPHPLRSAHQLTGLPCENLALGVGYCHQLNTAVPVPIHQGHSVQAGGEQSMCPSMLPVDAAMAGSYRPGIHCNPMPGVDTSPDVPSFDSTSNLSPSNDVHQAMPSLNALPAMHMYSPLSMPASDISRPVTPLQTETPSGLANAATCNVTLSPVCKSQVIGLVQKQLVILSPQYWMSAVRSMNTTTNAVPLPAILASSLELQDLLQQAFVPRWEWESAVTQSIAWCAASGQSSVSGEGDKLRRPHTAVCQADDPSGLTWVFLS